MYEYSVARKNKRRIFVQKYRIYVGCVCIYVKLWFQSEVCVFFWRSWGKSKKHTLTTTAFATLSQCLLLSDWNTLYTFNNPSLIQKKDVARGAAIHTVTYTILLLLLLLLPFYFTRDSTMFE